MSKIVMDITELTGIANAIRSKTGSTEKILCSKLHEEINSIEKKEYLPILFKLGILGKATYDYAQKVYDVSDRVSYDGKKSLRVHAIPSPYNENCQYMLRPTLAPTIAGNYTFSFKVKGNPQGGLGTLIKVYVPDEITAKDAKWAGNDIIKDIGNGWYSYTWNFTATSSFNTMDFGIYEADKDYFIDDMLLTREGDSVTNYILNGSFENCEDKEVAIFWTDYQNSGSVASYNYAFSGSKWKDRNFKPIFNLKVGTDSESMFNSCLITDLAKIMSERNVKFDFSSTTGTLSNTFASSAISHIPELNAPKVTKFSQTFDGVRTLITIDKIVCGESATFPNTFRNTEALENIVFEGTIGNDINFSACTKLTKKSIISIVNTLSSSSSGKTLTLSKTAKENAFTDDEWATLIVDKGNWTISLI